MADFIINGPSGTVIAGTGVERLDYTLASGDGGIVVTDLVDNGLAGYSGTVDVPGALDTVFSGIAHFTFRDRVGGNDTILTGGRSDALYGGRGVDVLNGMAGDDVLFGNAGRDRLSGGSGFDQLDGGTGNDVLRGQEDNDSLIGGDGNDRLFGGTGGDFFEAGTGNDVIDGAAGNDFIITGSGNDRAYAGTGDDFVEIDFVGSKFVDGGKGVDFLSAFITGPAHGDFVLEYNMRTGRHGAIGDSANESTISRIENYQMVGDVDAKVTGTDRGNVLNTGTGNDVIRGEGGNDTLAAGAGDDRLIGGRGNDFLDGGDGDDLLRGGTGVDEFWFMAGNDIAADFKDDTDKIRISSTLVDEGTTVDDLLDTNAAIVDGNAVLTFDGGHTLTILGVTDLTALADDMAII